MLRRQAAGGIRAAWRSRALIAVVLACMILLALRVSFRTTGTAAFRDPGWDRHLYLAMANGNPLSFHLAPYCWRVVVPLLVAGSPLTPQTTMLALTFAGLAAASVALFLLVRRWASRRVALVAVALFFSMGWGPKYLLSDFWLPDPVVFAVVAWAVLMAAERRALPFAIVLAVGAATKESSLVVAPLFYTLNARRAFDRQLAWQTVLAVLPAVVVLVGLRLGIEAWNGDPGYIATLPSEISRFPELFPRYDYLDLLQEVGREQRLRTLGADTFHAYTWRTFGALAVVLAALAVIREWRLALRFAPFLLLVYAQTLVATDTERLLVLGFPAVVVLAAMTLDHALPASRLGAGMAVLVAALAFGPNLWDVESYVPPGLVQVAAGAVFITALGVSRFLWRRENPPEASAASA